MLYIVMNTVGALGTGDVASVQLNEWTEFLNSCDIPDAASKFCKLKDCDQLFIQVRPRERHRYQSGRLWAQMSSITEPRESPNEPHACPAGGFSSAFNRSSPYRTLR